MVLKLYTGRRRGLVELLLVEKYVPYERIPVDLLGRQYKTPVIKSKSTAHRRDDDGFILCETRAICRYIAEKYADQGTPLLPTDLKAKALFEQAASFEAMNFHPHVLKATALYNEAQPEFMKDAVAALSEKLAVYDVILGKQKFLGGDELTLADLFHLYYAPVFAEKGVDVMTSSGPNVTRWWNELIHRPAWVKLKEADAAANK